MQEYDNHDADHSRKVLENIEKILQKRGICDLTLLEAMVLRLCCYFHDSGMILPQCYLPMIEDIERDPLAELPASLLPRLAELNKPFKEVENEFFCPKDERKYEKFLREQLEGYRKYRLGLAEELSGPEQHIRTRHTYFRMTHGERSGAYAQNLERFLKGLNTAGRQDLAKAVEEICSAHCWDYGKVRKMQADMKVMLGEPQMCGNKRYLAMLLRLGDLLHFSGERASRTVYAMRPAMTPDSDIHWRAKLAELEYEIKEDGGKLCIAFSAGFEEPKAYYFLQEYLNWVDEELRSYVFFQADMKGRPDAARYELGLPEKVDRSGIRYDKFRPAEELKFKLEHQKIIQLLMGMRLYRDEFMCLRELYQNALDACRCMREVNRSKGLEGELRIEFGLGSDEGGDYLYCRDQGTGMTEEIIQKYLLRIGNSYYQSDEFRRANALWGGAVAPVSEFGIGLLSCYMIASRIEVITRHHTQTAEPPIWICMEGSSDQGYYRDPGDLEPGTIGEHGTCVKLYLLDKYKPMVTDYLPEDVRDAVFLINFRDKKSYHWEDVYYKTESLVRRFEKSLYCRIQQFVHVPEAGIPVEVLAAGRRERLFRADWPYPTAEKLPMLEDMGVDIGEITGLRSLAMLDQKALLCGFDQCFCVAEDLENGIRIETVISLPNGTCKEIEVVGWEGLERTMTCSKSPVYIDGIPFGSKNASVLDRKGITSHFSGKLRPRLTVDRGEIREVQRGVRLAAWQVEMQLLPKVVAAIREYYRERPEVLTAEVKKWLFWYLGGKFEESVAKVMLKELSVDVLRGYLIQDVPLQEWFYGTKLELPPYFMKGISGFGKNIVDAIIEDALHHAVCLQICQGKVLLERPDGASWNLDIYNGKIVCADSWPEEYWQYDFLDAYPCLISCQLRDRLRKMDRNSSFSWQEDILSSAVSGDPVRLTSPNWMEVQMFLGEKEDRHQFYRIDDKFRFFETKNLRYVLYRYLAPRLLSDEDERFLNQYCSNSPEYREGVKNGWSILYYEWEHNVGFVIAPGIVDREEIVKLIPREVRERTDGSEYYFTDGERAF